MAEKLGTLYGIGVGPGDPELLTLKAARILSEVDVVFTAASPGNDYSVAQKITEPHLKPEVPVVRLNFPMTSDKRDLNESWRANAEEVAATLASGKSAAFLTLGDPLTFSTYSYILPYLAEILPLAPVVTIPGITSYQLSASRLNRPLVTGSESLTIVSGVEDLDQIEKILDTIENVAILKTYHSYDNIMALLKKKDMLKNAVLYTKVGFPEEAIYEDLENNPPPKPPYLSLMIIKNGGSH